MKRFSLLYIFFVLFVSLAFTQIKVENDSIRCYYGIQFEISDNPSWGYGELVVTQVEANSPAEKAGVKLGDIIMEIDDKATYLRDNDTITSWLLDKAKKAVTFSIRNISSHLTKVKLSKICFPANSVSEDQLARVFSFYSLENTSIRDFKIPLAIKPNPIVDFAEYHTYDFINEGELSYFDREVMNSIEKELQAKGMKRNMRNPDLVIQTYYSFDDNPQFNREVYDKTSTEDLKSWRFDLHNRTMKKVYAFDPEDGSKYANATTIVQFGISMYDRKLISQSELTQIWEGSLKDYVSDNYQASDYVKFHIPLILTQFPYTTQKDMVGFKIAFNRFNYTGLHFDSNDFSKIKLVDVGSPAYLAGIRAGQTIGEINGREFLYTKETLSEAYRLFIDETMKYRDPFTRFTSIEGYTQCMYWDKDRYKEIEEAFKDYKYLTQFGYLFNFERYVSGSNLNTINITAWNGKKKSLNITPIIKSSVDIFTY